MSLSAMVEIPRLQAKRRSVIPLKSLSRTTIRDGIYLKGMGWTPGFHRGDNKAWIPAFAGKTDGAVDFQSILSKSLGVEPRVV